MSEQTNVVQVGKYTISNGLFDQNNKEKVYIEIEDGEGGEFNAALLEPYIKDFFNKYF